MILKLFTGAGFISKTQIPNLPPSYLKEIAEGLTTGNMRIADIKKNYFDVIGEALVDLTT